MSETAEEGKRRPVDDDLAELLFLITEGKSLRAACRELGLDPPSTHVWLEADDSRRQQYARARELRGEFHAEQGLAIGYAAATGQKVEINGEEVSVDAAGARVALDAIKWSTARMSPKTAPVQKVAISHSFPGTDEELDNRIGQLLEGDGETSSPG